MFLVLGAVGLAPLLVLGWLSFSVNRAEIEKTVGRAQEETARAASRACEQWVAQSIEALRLSLSSIPFDQLSPSEMAAVLRLPYRQVEAVEALALLDEKGNALVPPLSDPLRTGPLPPDAMDEFARHVPLDYALAAGTAIGPPWVSKRGAGRLVVALRLGEAHVRVGAAQLSLRQLDRQLRELAQEGTAAWLVGRDGTVIAGDPGAAPGADEQLLVAQASALAVSRTVLRADGKQWLAAWAPVGDLGWGVMVAQPASLALRAADRVRVYTIFWALVTVCLVALLGALLSRSLTAPIRSLSVAAIALREGRYDQPAELQSRDELGAFAETFNHMGREVRRRDEEIRGWNAELQARVETKTQELKEAQDQILRTRRLAALGSMGAGLAHELNNPLTAISGIAQLLQRELGAGSEHAAVLKMLAEQVGRVVSVGNGLRQFAEQERITAGRKFSLQGPVLAALEACRVDLVAHGILIVTDVRAPLPEAQGDPAQIQQLVGHLIQNAIQAMPEGGQLTVTVADVAGEALKLTVADTGKGIPAPIRERIFDPFFTTKPQAAGVGLGLSIAHSVVRAHHGKITVESPEGQGATFTILLPAAGAAAHLS